MARRTLPRSGRPRRIPRETIEQIVSGIHEETGTKLLLVAISLPGIGRHEESG